MKDKTLNMTVIGCGDAFSSGGRLQTCFHIQAPGGTFLIDCGASSIAALKQRGFDLRKIDTILISHFHGDHYGGLPYFLLEAAVFEWNEPLTIISPPGCKEKVAALLGILYPGSKVLEKLPLRFLEYPDKGELEARYLRVEGFPVTHAPATDPHGLRITTAEKTISYSGDTCWDENLLPIAENADLFICECNFFDTKSAAHLDYQTLTGHLPRLSFNQILLTHLGEEMLLNLDSVKLPCAEDGLLIRV
ncbi:ribonuclease BN (tRNA processing enzyme) [Anseongella ginsenosidimutans]|uniref:Ribonuclease BN (tRNA processing enzyme) n=1 Tax=Anseongella ginsenosidimutans TaxID=496056 RepID=A0A4R3KR10_9SPHI|nr:MBL fold metallo-hydrolase [Anseongella ginsenosidimutans]QEC53736.1 MBL fold metallo-hydrolase [Anseongella ginsenosidimutans]TCS86008.1 ribonuclease BN (tRNA processing enzyme) [Anseongella ginsenosidimutans]